MTTRQEEILWVHIYLFILSLCILTLGVGLSLRIYSQWCHFLNCIGGNCV